MGRASQQPRGGQGDAALSDSESWFPRPASVADVDPLDSSGALGARELFELLTSPDGEELRHKVGVAGRADGSGKPSTRLLAVRGWILKSNLAELEASRDVLKAKIVETRARGLGIGGWHHSKHWAMFRTERGWLPLGACRELATLRRPESIAERMHGWTRMIDMGLDIGARHGIGFDLNPANFAVEPDGARLYYLDDELYPTFELRNIASAIVARIPEEPESYESTWRGWGEALREVLDVRGVSRRDRDVIAEEILRYPLVEGCLGMREALLEGVRANPVTVRPPASTSSRRDLVCVLADVHANLPALEAVLAAAKAHGATSYLFLGDAVGYGPHPKACVERLAELGATSLVKGNHDHAIGSGRFDFGMNRLARACAEWTRDSLGPAELDWLDALPTEHVADGWMAVHGAPRDPHRFLAYVYDLTFEENLTHMGERGVELCFHGHTHLALIHIDLPTGPKKLSGVRDLDLGHRRVCLVNPGSVGQPRDGDQRAAFALWDRGARRVTLERVPYRIDRTLRDLERAQLPMELASRLTQGS